MSMGGQEKLERRRASGVLNARERVAYLVDPDAWQETGLYGVSMRSEMRHKTPADGKITGFGKVNGRQVGVVANDFTVLGASSSSTAERKVADVKRTSKKRGIPVVFLNESSGARMPDLMGAAGMAGIDRPDRSSRFLRNRVSPWASAVLGNGFGSSAWHASMSDFNVMRKGSVMAVASPRLVSLATKGTVDPEELGGWKVHSEVTGFVDLVVDTDEEALDAVKRFLSYLPDHAGLAPPRSEVPEGSGEACKGLLDILPESRTKVYDVRKVIHAVVDSGSCFELKPRFGKPLVTALARLDGRSVGIVANNPFFKGGAPDMDACRKVTSFLVLCDSYNIPLIFLVDQPGFLIGMEAERRGIVGGVVNWMNALSLCTVPKVMVVLRKSYGQAYVNMGGAGLSDATAVWWTADTSFMDPAAGATIVYGVTEEDDPEGYREALSKMTKDTSAYDMAAVYGVQDVIDPRDTREYLRRTLEIHEPRVTGGVGQHLMSNWPTNF